MPRTPGRTVTAKLVRKAAESWMCSLRGRVSLCVQERSTEPSHQRFLTPIKAYAMPKAIRITPPTASAGVTRGWRGKAFGFVRGMAKRVSDRVDTGEIDAYPQWKSRRRH